MKNDKKKRLEEAIVSIRREYGEDALRILGKPDAASPVPCLSTGFAALDRALGIGGLPKGHLTQVSGIPTSGAKTLACKLLAQGKGESIVYIDLPQTFDADHAARCGVDIASLLLIQPQSIDHALEILTTLVEVAAVVVFVLDTPDKKLHVDRSAVNRLVSALRRSRCVLLFVEQAATPLFSQQAAVHLHFQRERWLRQREDVNGYRTHVRILKNQWGRTGQSVSLVIGFTSVTQGDGT